MTLPTLLHPVQVKVERLIRSEMLMDVDAREPVHGTRTTARQTFTLPAQIKWSDTEEASPQEAGTREEDRGYILCRTVDMDLLLGPGSRLKRGDRIIAIGHEEGLDLYITGSLQMGHYLDQNGSSLIRYRFSDRHPTRQDGDL